jgi:CRISPR system Cascade subunit CasA
MSFNLIDEPFIPCLMPDGSQHVFGLRAALVRAHQIAEIHDSSPLVSAALHRLLLAILHRIWGPASRKEWARLWQARSFAAQAVDQYFEKWRSRFNLLDKKYPFYQSPFQAKTTSRVNRLAQDLARGNNGTLFDHTTDDAATPLMPSELARLLIAEQAFAVGGGKSDLGNLTHGPLVSGAFVLVRGATLFETMLLNLVVYNADKPFAAEDDQPAWEQEVAPTKRPEQPDGYLDYLTWQARTICAHPCDDPPESTRDISYAQGRRLQMAQRLDPCMAYVRDKERGDFPIRLSENRALWRDSAALFQFAETDQDIGPATLQQLGILVADGVIPPESRYQLSIFGLCTGKAKVNFWRQETLPLPLEYVTDRAVVESLDSALQDTQAVADALRSAAASVASQALSPTGRADRERVGTLVASLAPDRLYWSRLEVPFRQFLVQLPGDIEHRQGRLQAWFDELCQTARRAFQEATESLDRSARLLRAFSIGRSTLEAGLGRLSKEFRIDAGGDPHAPRPTDAPEFVGQTASLGSATQE